MFNIFEIMNLFKELMNAKEIKKAKLVSVRGWLRNALGIKVWYDDSDQTYVFTDSTELDNFIKELKTLGITIEGL